MDPAAIHVPVLADEVTHLLRARRAGWLVDGTVGLGGHAERLLEASAPGARLLGLDGDADALARAGARLARFGERAVLRHGSFRRLASHAAGAGVTEAESVLLDLGLSSYQLEASRRGFTFQGDEPLDMRFDATQGPTAAELVNSLPEAELARILYEHGEESSRPGRLSTRGRRAHAASSRWSTRSFALRARGFIVVSSRCGTTGDGCNSPKPSVWSVRNVRFTMRSSPE